LRIALQGLYKMGIKYKKIFIVTMTSLFLCGCATLPLPESEWERTRLEKRGMKKGYELDLSKTNKTGRLLIHCIPPSQQMLVNNYEIQIDNNSPFEVFKYSDVTIILDMGGHLITINAKDFGKTSQKKVFISEDRTENLSYAGPYWMWSSGKLE
jgi:hypothetical protein